MRHHSSIPSWFKKSLASPLFWVLLAAAAIRLAYFFEIRADAAFTVPIWDAAVFDDMARSLAAGHGTGFPKAFYFGPLYPFYLAAIYALSGASSAVAVVFQHALGVLLCALTYRLGLLWFNRRVALVAAWFMAFSGLQIFFEGTLLMEALVSFLLAGYALLLAGMNPHTPRWRFLAAGLLLGLGATGRPTLLLLAPLVGLPLAHFRGTVPTRWILQSGVVFLIGLTLAPSAAMVRNYRVEKVLIPITASGGFNFYLGNAGDNEGLFLDNPRISADSSWNGEETAETALGRQLNSAELSSYWWQLARRDIQSHPVRWLKKYFAKIQLFLNGQDVHQIESYTHARSRSTVLGFTPWRLHLLMALALAGGAAALPRWRGLVLPFALIGILVLAAAAFFVTTRYRVVALPYLSLFAASFLDQFWTAGRCRRLVPLSLLAALAVAGFLFAHPTRFPLSERNRDYAQFLHDGFKYAKVGQDAAALAAYEKARVVRPEDYESYLGMGIVHQTGGRYESSLLALEAAMQRNDVDADVPYQLGVTLHKMNRQREAESALQQSLALNPRRALTHAYLALALASQGRYVQAKESFQTAMDLNPDEPFILSNFGTLLAMEGDRVAARQKFQRALEVDPGYVHALRNLAFICIDDGEPQAAVQLLRRLLKLAPDDQQAQRELAKLEN